MTDITDQHVVEQIRQRLASRDRYFVSSITLVGDSIDLRLSVNGDSRDFGIRLPAPSSSGVPVWLYAEPIDASDWVGMLGIWMDEEILTGAAHWADLTESDGLYYFTVELYGFRRADAQEHKRLVEHMSGFPGGFGWTYYGGEPR